MASTEILNKMRSLLVLLAGACSGTEVYNKEIKLSKESSLDSRESLVPWGGERDLGGTHLLQSRVPRGV